MGEMTAHRSKPTAGLTRCCTSAGWHRLVGRHAGGGNKGTALGVGKYLGGDIDQGGTRNHSDTPPCTDQTWGGVGRSSWGGRTTRSQRIPAPGGTSFLEGGERDSHGVRRV